MYLRLFTCRPVVRWSFCALAILSMSAGCTGGSDTDSTDQVTEKTASGTSDEARGDEYWAELALGYAEYVPEPGIGAVVPADEWISKGRWEEEIIEWPEIAVGAANMLDGRIVTFASFLASNFGSGPEITKASIFDPATGVFEDAGHTSHNMFCAGVSMLPDGRMFAAGGGAHVSTVSVFEDNQFREIDSMAMARWYPTSTTLASGQVMTSLGTSVAGNSELWTPNHGWQILDNVDLQSALEFPYGYNDWYPALNVTPSGSLFHPGPNNELFSINLDQDDAYVAHGPREVNGNDRLYNTTVIYDVGKMLVAGGGQQDAKNTAITIDLNGATPVVEAAEPMSNARAMQNSVVLPNGEVLVIGGNSTGIQFSDEGSVVTPEIWNPDTGQWREVAPHVKPRNYHSTALLLRDGRVIAMGGGLCGECKTNHQNGEIYEPPYLFDAVGQSAPRPSIDGGAVTAKAGDAITLTGSNDIVEFNMVRLVAVTHHHSTDQRLVPAPFTKVADGNYELQLNANPNVLIPGYYWIFGLDQNGVPSVGHQIEVQVTTDFVETPITTDNNINYAYYEGLWPSLPDFSAMTPVATGTQSNFSLNNRQRNWAYGFVFTGNINVPADGDYTFYMSSDDGSRLSIDGNVVITHDGDIKFQDIATGQVSLSAGQHAIRVEYFEHNASDGLLVSWSSDAMPKRPVTRFDLGSQVIDATAAVTPTPVVTPDPDPVVTPDPDPVVTPDPDPVVTPDPDPVVTPDPDPVVTPDPDPVVTPDPDPVVTPDPDLIVTPDPNAVDPGSAPASVEPLLNYAYYEGDWNALPVFESLQPVKEGFVDSFTLDLRDSDDFYAMLFEGKISVASDGEYSFYVNSDDGSKLYVGEQLVVDNDGVHVAAEQSGVVTLVAGVHDVRVEFFEKTGNDQLEVLWSGPGFEKRPVVSSDLVIASATPEEATPEDAGPEGVVLSEDSGGGSTLWVFLALLTVFRVRGVGGRLRS